MDIKKLAHNDALTLGQCCGKILGAWSSQVIHIPTCMLQHKKPLKSVFELLNLEFSNVLVKFETDSWEFPSQLRPKQPHIGAECLMLQSVTGACQQPSSVQSRKWLFSRTRVLFMILK